VAFDSLFPAFILVSRRSSDCRTSDCGHDTIARVTDIWDRQIMKISKGKLLVRVLCPALIWTPLAAPGQTPGSPAGESGLAEITVTAQKRDQNIQDVPIDMVALSGEMLQNRSITSIVQLGNYTPGVQLSNSSQIVGSSQSLSAFIRGIGQDDFSAGFDPGVGTYIDGVYLARTIGANVNLLDVERVEILKGPQGTLFGRNTIGGAISVATRDPAPTAGITAELTGGRFDRYGGRFVADLPLSDALLSSIAVSASSVSGFEKRIPFPGASAYASDSISEFAGLGIVPGEGAHSTLGGSDDVDVRGKLLWKATERLRVTLIADYAHSSGSTQPYTLIAVSTAPGTLSGVYNTCINTPVAALAAMGLGAVCGPRLGPGTALGGVNTDANPGNNRLPYDSRFITGNFDTTYGTGNNFSQLDNWGLASTITYEIFDHIALKSITAFRRQDWNVGTDPDGSPIIMFEPNILQDEHQVSQEFQLTGDAIADRLHWLLGSYYLSEDATEQQNPILAGGMFPIYNPTVLQTESGAAFTHLNFKLTDRWQITAGGRYTKEKKWVATNQQDLNLFLAKLGVPASAYPDPSILTQLLPIAQQERSFDNFSPHLGLEYHPADDMMLYASFSKGYKSGGWTTRVSFPQKIVPTFDPETAATYEIGMKSQFLDHRLQVDLAAFTTQYKAIQLLIQEGVSPTFVNAGDARIKGIEIDTEAAITDTLHVTASAGYIDAFYTSIEDPTGVITLESSLPKVAKWTAHIGADYQIHLPWSGSVTLRGDDSFKSRVANDADNTPQLFAQGVSLVDLSATYRPSLGNWSFIAGGTNVTNRRYLVNGETQLGGAGMIFGVSNRPAEWYVTARTKF
jgi:iron complex outermembrane receptor protein